MVGRWCLQLPRYIGHSPLGCIGNPRHVTAGSPVQTVVAATSIEAVCEDISPTVSRKERNWRLIFVNDRSSGGSETNSSNRCSRDINSLRKTSEYCTSFGNHRYYCVAQRRMKIGSKNLLTHCAENPCSCFISPSNTEADPIISILEAVQHLDPGTVCGFTSSCLLIYFLSVTHLEARKLVNVLDKNVHPWSYLINEIYYFGNCEDFI